MDAFEHGAAARTMDCDVAVIGAGPAGLMAAEGLASKGLTVHVFEAKSSAGRKFLMAGKGGLNLTHSENLPAFVSRYGERSAEVSRWLELLPRISCVPGPASWAWKPLWAVRAAYSPRT